MQGGVGEFDMIGFRVSDLGGSAKCPRLPPWSGFTSKASFWHLRLSLNSLEGTI